MTTIYTASLGLALPVTGELSGTWGDVVNNYITQYTDSAVAGSQIISGSQTAVTLSTTNGASLVQAGSVGTTGSAQYQIINCTGNPAGLLTITAPAISKSYIVINATSTNQSVKIVGVGPTTGVTLVAGEKAVIAWNGSDFTKVVSTIVSAANLTGSVAIANGGTGQTTASAAFNALSPITTTGDLIIGNGANSATRLAIGANGAVLTSNGTTATWATPIAGTVTSVSWTGGIVSIANPTTTPAFTIAGTSGGIPYFSSGTTWASSAALAANALVIGGGAGAAPATTTTGTGVVTALGNNANSASGFVTGTGTATLQSKRIDPRVTSTASASSLTPDVSAADIYAYTALAANLTINAPIGTPLDGDKLIFRILDNGTPRTLTWNATYTAIGVALPTTTTANKIAYIGCIYNANNTRWDVIAVALQA